MAQTKRKRRNKHRGNAVGMVEARGRTSKPREGQKPARAAGARRAAPALKPPTFQGSALKALIGAAILFIFFTLTDRNRSVVSTLVFCLFAVALYTPVMFWTDKWVYRRKLRAQQGGTPAARGRR